MLIPGRGRNGREQIDAKWGGNQLVCAQGRPGAKDTTVQEPRGEIPRNGGDAAREEAPL